MEAALLLPPAPNNFQSQAALYSWLPLKEDDETRVLVLKPGNPESPRIECELHHVRLCENPAFEAISYAWDTDVRDHYIYLAVEDGDDEELRMAVTANLYLALVQFRRTDDKRVLWADAISIDQTNIQEKARQVQMMGRIFHAASEVQVWLGPQEEISYVMFETIRALGEFAPTYIRPQRQPNRNEAVIADMRLSFAEVLARSWFSRVWVVQEVVQARVVTIHCGAQAMLFEEFAEGVQQLHAGHIERGFDPLIEPYIRGNPRYAITSTGIQGIKIMSMLRKRSTQGQGLLPEAKMGIMHLLRMTRYAKSTDPRDRVFALLSMAGDNVPLPFDADYTLSVEEIYGRLAMWYYLIGSLDMMSYACVPCTETTLTLPSWVPNWTSPEQFEPLWEVGGYFRAGGDFEIPGISGGAAQGLLHLEGKIVDRVAELMSHPESQITGVNNSIFNSEERDEERLNRAHAFFQDSETLTKKTWNVEQFSDAEYERYWRTLICNSDEQRNVAPSRWRTEFENFSRYIAMTPSQRNESIKAWTDNVKVPNDKYHGKDVFSIDCLGMQFDGMHHLVARGRAFMATTRGRVGWAARTAREGDSICVFRGAEVPFLIREKEGGEEGTWMIVAECYVEGIMMGEAFGDPSIPMQEMRIA